MSEYSSPDSSRARPGRALMVVGTCSDAGKSILVTALCRIFARRGLRVAPFKAQNMSLNSAVTPEGHEIARSTCVQAEAAGLLPHVDMNPVLLKPEAQTRSQVVLAGRATGFIEASNWQTRKDRFWAEITASLDRLRQRFDLVILEGAGSPAEINLAAGDVTNLRVACYADAPALLVGDIDRGGVFASLYGTVLLLEPEQQKRVQGFVINKLRGDAELLAEGPEMLRQKTGVPTLGVVPFLRDIGVAEEDSVALDRLTAAGHPRAVPPGATDLAVIRFPHLANFDDFDPLLIEENVHLRWVEDAEQLGRPAAVILPGTKTTLHDLAWLRSSGLAPRILELAAAGTQIVGLCGGYQMLGRELSDPEGVEAEAGSEAPGLGLLDRRTLFVAEKRTRRVQATCRSAPGPLAALEGLSVMGYEIHMGLSEPQNPDSTLFQLHGLTPEESSPKSRSSDDFSAPDPLRNGSWAEGAYSMDGHVWGTYLHGLFDNDPFRHGWLRSLGWKSRGRAFDRQAAYDRLADHFESHLDMDAIEALIGPLDRSFEKDEVGIGNQTSP